MSQDRRNRAIDAMRGFALLGVVVINAPFLAAPLASVSNPELAPLGRSAIDVWTWCATHVLFEAKSISLFCILFGASLIMVGGDGADPERRRGLRRRLAWLAVFGLAHGLLIWFGDILLSYALAGSLAVLARGWRPRTLLLVGTGGVLVSAAMIGAVALSLQAMPAADLARALALSWSPDPAAIQALVDRYREGLVSAMGANAQTWIETQFQSLIFLTPRSAGLMLIGMALFKTGFLQGHAPGRTYVWAAVCGAAALGALALSTASLSSAGFPVLRLQGEGILLQSLLSPLASLGYASGLVLLLKADALPRLTSALAAAGRMAFTHYVAQSVILSTIFWGGRGLGLYGALARTEVLILAVSLFAVQVAASGPFLSRFGSGPMEALWRRLTWGKAGRPEPQALRTRAAWSDGTVPAVFTRALTRRFGERLAVDGVELEVPAGAVYGFLGRNGSGKTTTIRMLLGLIRPSAGEISVFGADVATQRRTAARSIGALLDAGSLYDHLTGRENLEVTRRLLGLPQSAIDQALEAVDLRSDAGRRVGHYSLGMRQRLGLARALLGGPRLLILDEPMNGLDPDGIRDMGRLIRDLPGRTGATVFLSSHLLSEVERTATHIGLMRDGRLVRQGRLQDLLRSAAPDLIVRVDRLEDGERVLRGAGFASVREGDGLRVAGAGDEKASARAASVLAAAGLALWELSPRSRDLEALYLGAAGAA